MTTEIKGLKKKNQGGILLQIHFPLDLQKFKVKVNKVEKDPFKNNKVNVRQKLNQ